MYNNGIEKRGGEEEFGYYGTSILFGYLWYIHNSSHDFGYPSSSLTQIDGVPIFKSNFDNIVYQAHSTHPAIHWWYHD